MNACRERIQQRAEVLATIRQFFTDRGVLEVDTPHLANAAVSDVHLESLKLCDGRYLNTSPEYAMKALLAAGSGDIYQLAHVFRAEELGRRHRCEFMMLEWYRLGFDAPRLMQEVMTLVRLLLPQDTAPTRILRYGELFVRHCGFNPHTITDEDLFAAAAHRIPESRDWSLSRDACLELLYGHVIEPELGQQSFDFVCDWPASQAALARLMVVDGQEVAARFELYRRGLELCNGFWELNDAAEQRQRFEADNAERGRMGLPVRALDENFLAVVGQLPDCAGVAVGIDRLLMLRLGQEDIAHVQVFPL